MLTDDGPREAFFREGYLSAQRVLSAAEAEAACRPFHDLVDSGRYLGHTQAGPGAPHVSFKPHLIHTWLDRLAHHGAILDAVERIIGPDILIWASALFIKEPFDPSYAAWHQDINYNTLEEREHLSTWLALTPSTVENGCLRVIPRSHIAGRLAHEETDDPHNYLARRERLRAQHPTSQPQLT